MNKLFILILFPLAVFAQDITTVEYTQVTPSSVFAFDARSKDSCTSSCSSLTQSHPGGASASSVAIILHINSFYGDASSVTYGGVNLTKMISQSATGITLQIWASTAIPSGTQTVVVTLNNTFDGCAYICQTFNGSTTTFGTPVSATGTGTSGSLSVTNSSSSIVIAGVNAQENISAGQVFLEKIYEQVSYKFLLGEYSTGTANATMSATFNGSTPWDMVAIPVNP